MTEQLSTTISLASSGNGPVLWSGRLCATGELPEDEQSLVIEIDGRRIAIYRVAGTLYVLDDYCTHANSSLSQDGSRCELVVECALHNAKFSLETGMPLVGPTRKPLRRYELTFDGEDVIATELPKAKFSRPGSTN